MTGSSEVTSGSSRRRFHTTQWSVVLSAGSESSAEQKSALDQLCETYWYPLYSFARGKGFDSETAADITQGFFADLLQRNDLATVRKEKGRFRSFLLASLRNFIANQMDRQRSIKRGGQVRLFSIDAVAAENRYLAEPEDRETPEVKFEKAWALTLLDRVRDRLRQQFIDAGKSDLFSRLSVYLGGAPTTAPAYAEIADDLGMTESAIKVNVHRMRKEFRSLLRQEIADTVAEPADVDDELNSLFESLRA